MKKETNKHILKIKQLYPDASEIYRPSVLGCIHDIYIVKKDNDKFVFRFSDEQTAIHNLYVSRLLLKNSIPVPNIEIYNMDSEYCEIYPFIEGKTLHERLQEGLNGTKLDTVYRQLFCIAHKISQIPYDDNTQICVPWTTKWITRIFNVLNPKSQELCHYDLYAKNVILDEADNICALIDLDAVTNISLRFSFMMIMRDAIIYGYDIDKLKKISTEFKQTYGIISVNTQLKIYTGLKKLFKSVFNDYMRKQLLKIKVK